MSHTILISLEHFPQSVYELSSYFLSSKLIEAPCPWTWKVSDPVKSAMKRNNEDSLLVQRL